LDENDAGKQLTDIPDLPDQMDSTGAQLTGIIAVNKPLQIWQLRRDPEATSCQKVFDYCTIAYLDSYHILTLATMRMFS
jgi:hypothetical protein